MNDVAEGNGGATIDIPDRVLHSWVTTSSGFQNSQRHSITTAAYYAWSIPIVFLFFLVFVPPTTDFISVSIDKVEISGLPRGPAADSPGDGFVPFKVTVLDRAFGTYDDFLLEVWGSRGEIYEQAYLLSDNNFASVNLVDRKYFRDSSIVSAFRVENLRPHESVSFLFWATKEFNPMGSSVADPKIGIASSIPMMFLQKRNIIYEMFAIVAATLLYWAFEPYFRGWRAARNLGKTINQYVDDINVNQAKSPFGRSYDDVISELQKVKNRMQKREAGPHIKEYVRSFSLEHKDGQSLAGGESTRVLGPFNVAGHPTFSRVWGLLDLKYLILRVDTHEQVTAWKSLTAKQVMNPTGDVITLDTR